MVMLETEDKYEEYVADALKCVQLKFVGSIEEIGSAPGFEPEFAHQHFGESENIIGYKDLDVTVCYSDSSLFIYPSITYSSKVPANLPIKAEDIIYKIRDQLPSIHLDALVSTSANFQAKLQEQKTFKPYGELVTKFTADNSEGNKEEFHVYRVESTDNEETNRYLERAQSLGFWYIDGASYTDTEDPRFFHYFVYEYLMKDASPKYKFAGYSSLYRFYYYPDKERIRIAHLMIAPPYRGSGNGIRFLDAIYSDLRSNNKVYDITAESPADNFLYMRDYSDCLSCSTLPEFSKVKLLQGYSIVMKTAAREKLKLHDAQTRRVYEILRLFHTGSNAKALESYKAEVIKRIEKPFLRSKRDVTKLAEALNPNEMTMVTHNLEPEQQRRLVEEQYNNTIESYRVVLDRLARHEPSKFVS
ncbi:histone acetyltransferase type B catalytic subunit [Ditylenchus destructor]|nr:histone acetyltransferase type B catalytic subunit [Ditylenchus destructor]